MMTTGIFETDVSLRKVGSLLGAVALSTALLSGCGGDSSAEGETTGTSSGQEAGDSKKSSGEDLPDGFPGDVPLPEHTSVKKLGGSEPGDDFEWWSVMVMLKNPTDTPVEDYSAQLSDAGYTVSTESGTTEAVGPDWEIQFHTSMENTLTVGLTSK